ncbi:hypothetical protein GF402_00800 [Candidatus Fermentibacteria bacterium]|nr:hypothetical protein [Candidatus Fermentibacteria bacterium]
MVKVFRFGTSLLLLPLLGGTLSADVSEAMERLSGVTDRLLVMGESMVGDPISGSMAVAETVSVDLTLSTEYSYHLHVWTDSIFNILEFWLSDPSDSVADQAVGDHATLVVFPDTSGRWSLNMILVEGDLSDSASYAASLFHRPRVIPPDSLSAAEPAF